MRGIKMPQQYFALKRHGGLCARGGGGLFAGHYGINIMAYFYAACAVHVTTFSTGRKFRRF